MDKPAQYDIAQRAYELWERDGRPQGRDQEYWFHAEREMIGATTAEEDRPIGEIRQAQQASAERRKSARQDAPPSSAQPTPSKTTGSDLAEQLDALQSRLASKEAKPRAKKSGDGTGT